jgi:hypothetical protein
MPFPTIELLYFPGCPNLPAAREQLQRALSEAGLAPRWAEHDVSSVDAPERMRGYGSPTILVGGRDVTGEAPAASGSSCRLYSDSDSPGAPPLETILRALRSSGGE